MLTRVVTGALAAAVALAAILWREPWAFLVLLGGALVFSTLEVSRIASASVLAAMPAALLLVGVFSDPSPIGQSLILGGLIWIVAAVSIVLWVPNNRWSTFGLFWWVPAGVVVALELKLEQVSAIGSFGTSLLLLALLPLWVGDSLAYFVGKAIGRHKMAPNISPNKTWEGAIANLIGCLAAAFGIGLWLKVPLAASIAVGLTTGILGQVGDLLQSRLKRLAGVKDSGSLLPGHGGVLDRLDSFLFSSYPSLLALYLLAPDMFHVKQWPW